MPHHWLIGLTLLSLPFWWSEPVTWAFEDAQLLEDVADDEQWYFNPILSPDGSAFAWDSDNATCVHRFEEAETTCYPHPQVTRLRSSWANLPAWSPDGRYIALTENFFTFFYDSDIWTLDTQTGEYTNHTDDGYYGGAMRSSSIPDDLPADFLPTWNPATGELYFFRSQRREPILVDTGYTLQLYKLDVNGGEPELVRDLTLAIPGPFSVYRPVAFNDNGTKLALLVLTSTNMFETAGAGVWVLDFANGRTDFISHVAPFGRLMPEWTERRYVPQAIQWAGDDLVVWVEDYSTAAGPLRTPMHLDTETRVITPLVDFSAYAEAPDYFNARTAEPQVDDSAVVGTVLPGGNTYWLITAGTREEPMGVFELPLPGQDGEPRLVTTIPYQLGPGQEVLPTMSDDGKLLMLQTLFTLREVEAE